MSLKIYDGKNHTMVLADIPISQGLGEDFIKVNPVGPAYVTSIGADGEVCRSASNEKRYKIELTLMNSSKHNQELSALHALDTNSSTGAGVGAGFIKDNNGARLMAFPQCWIEQAPDWTGGKENGESTWLLEAVGSPATVIYGGN